MKNQLRLVLLVMLSLVITACCPECPTPVPAPTSTTTIHPTNTASPTTMPTSTLTPTATATNTSVPTNTPTVTPTGFPLPSAEHYLLGDFEDRQRFNQIFGEYIYEGSDDNNVLKLTYSSVDQTVYYYEPLNNADFSEYDTLTLFARGDSEHGIPEQIKLELARLDWTEIGEYYLIGLTDEWQQFVIPLENFTPSPDANSSPLCGWDEMSGLQFAFNKEYSGEFGIVYLDNIHLEKRGDGAPELGPECVTPTPVPPTPRPATPVPPMPPPAPSGNALMTANFDSCSGTNNLGGAMGAAYNSPDKLTETYPAEAGRGCVAKLEYNISGWSAFWMMLQGTDLTPYTTLKFDVRADGGAGQMKIELKRANNTEVSIIYVSGISSGWQTFSVNLADFYGTGYTSVLSSLTNMEELVFTFEANRSGRSGTVYLDNVRFEP